MQMQDCEAISVKHQVKIQAHRNIMQALLPTTKTITSNSDSDVDGLQSNNLIFFLRFWILFIILIVILKLLFTYAIRRFH